MQIYIYRNNEQLGPFTEAEIKAQLAAGTTSLQDNVWWEGQGEWMPLEQTSLAPQLAATAPVSAPIPAATMPATFVAVTSEERTSGLAIGSLVCGVLSFVCGFLAAIPAIILGHMALSSMKNDPAIKGKGLALTGLVLGYLLGILAVIGLVIFISMGHQMNEIFKTLNSQMAAAQLQTNSDQTAPSTTNSADESTNSSAATNTPDQTTNSTPATDSGTNSSTPDTNAPAAADTNSTTPSAAPGTNAAPADTNAAPAAK